MSEKNNKFSFHSINFHLWMYFTLFAVLVVALIGGLLYFMITNYYGDLKEKDTERMSAEIKQLYRDSGSSTGFASQLYAIASANDVNIYITRKTSSSEWTGQFKGMNPMYSQLLNESSIIDRLSNKLTLNNRLKRKAYKDSTSSGDSSDSKSSDSSGRSSSSDSSGSSGSSNNSSEQSSADTTGATAHSGSRISDESADESDEQTTNDVENQTDGQTNDNVDNQEDSQDPSDNSRPVISAAEPEESDRPSIRGLKSSSARITTTVGNGMSVLAYATEITSRDDMLQDTSTVLYIFAPLYPATSTLRILSKVLGTTLFIALLMALAIAMIISNRISRPIDKITKSAAKLSHGDYDVKFEGQPYDETMELAHTLTVAENEMKKTDEYHRDLIANVSHDLRTPLTMIKSYAEMIRDLSGDFPEKRNRHLGVIIEESDRLNNMVSDLLNLSRLQSHKIELEKKDFDLNEAVDNMLSTYKLMQESEGYSISFKKCKGPSVISADPARIDQIMNNLLSNAIKYCGEDKQVIIETVKEDNNKAIRFSVTDHGQGIKPEELPHVWDRYYKSSTHHVRETKGSGIGLSICKELLKLHDADYGVVSEVGKGSTFWFKLPLVQQQRSLLGLSKSK
ncbi:MAG: HAMP domain-containing sensor histidine kinase [Eubacteriales bacterium]|nr:HAMP domain-containing sensor histidine kinase [Eubacteriales bacterium]